MSDTYVCKQDAIGTYRVRKLLHSSAKTAIFLAETAMGDTVVVKRCSALEAEQERATMMMLKKADPECTHFIRLLDHVTFAAEDADPWEALVMEAGSMSMESWLRARQYRPSWAEVLDVGSAVGSAVAWLHAQGLCHTDLKPANVVRVDGARAGPIALHCFAHPHAVKSTDAAP
jgi:serine/threonine protein kinase